MDTVEFKTSFPEFGMLEDGLIETHLQRARVFVAQSVWGDYEDEAIGLMTAHELTIQENNFLDKQKKAAAIATGKDYRNEVIGDYFESTSFGARFLQLKKRLIKTGFVL